MLTQSCLKRGFLSEELVPLYGASGENTRGSEKRREHWPQQPTLKILLVTVTGKGI